MSCVNELTTLEWSSVTPIYLLMTVKSTGGVNEPSNNHHINEGYGVILVSLYWRLITIQIAILVN